MNENAEHHDRLQREATAAAIKAARAIGLGQTVMNTPIGRVTEEQWGWIVAAAIFGWIEARARQAIAEGCDGEAFIRATGLSPDPCDVAVVRSILPELADKAGIDWSRIARGLARTADDEFPLARLAAARDGQGLTRSWAGQDRATREECAAQWAAQQRARRRHSLLSGGPSS